jgi:hypothetical protein
MAGQRDANDQRRKMEIGLDYALPDRQGVVALQSEIVEARGVSSPAGSLGIFRANDVSSGAHLHATESEGPVNQRHFQLDGHAGLDFAGREERDSARADIPGNQRDGNRFDGITDSRQAQRQR